MLIKTRKTNESYINSHAYYKLIAWLTKNELIDKFIANTSKERLHKLNREEHRDYDPTTILRIAFNYDQTPEGFEYWSGVTDRLEKSE